VIRQIGGTIDDLSTCTAVLTRHLQVQLHVYLVDDAGSWSRSVSCRNSVGTRAAWPNWTHRGSWTARWTAHCEASSLASNWSYPATLSFPTAVLISVTIPRTNVYCHILPRD
jgi:hypothetical protein